jgi:multiple antibiotic resistance protein
MTQLGPAEIFTLFFVTLGPLKILGPFAQRTHDLDTAAIRAVAVRAFTIATIAIVVGSLAGRSLAAKWHIEIAALTIAAGIIFLLVALKQLLQQYEPPHAVVAPPPLPASPMGAALQLLFPIVLTPYGIAAAIVLLAHSQDEQRTIMILALLVGVMILNLIAMLFARKILVGLTMVVLQVLGAVLGVLQAGFAVEFILAGMRGLPVMVR